MGRMLLLPPGPESGKAASRKTDWKQVGYSKKRNKGRNEGAISVLIFFFP